MRKIGFLTSANSWHVPVKTKYFVSKGYDVYYLQIHPGTNQVITPKGVTCIDIKSTGPKFLRYFILASRTFLISKQLKLDIIHVIGIQYLALFAIAKRLIVENNGSDVLVLPNQRPWLKYLYKIIYLKADAVVQDSVVSQNAGIQLGASEENNKVIELGVDFTFFNENVIKGIAKAKLKIKHEKFVFSPRRMTSLYNIETIILSIPIVKVQYPDVKYVFCSDIRESKNRYFKIIDKLGLKQNVIFTGFLDNEEELPFYYADSDVVVSVPSSDSSPRSVYEAMACFTPVIISELPWYKDKFKKGVHVSVVPVKNERILAEEIIAILNNPTIIDKKGAFEFVKKEINMTKSSKSLESLYKKLFSASS